MTIGTKVCERCNKTFSYTKYTEHRAICGHCTYVAQFKPKNGSHDEYIHDKTEGYPNYIVAFLHEQNEQWLVREKEKPLQRYEIGVKRGVVGTHKQLGAM